MHIGFLTPQYVKKNQPHGGIANYIHKVAGELIKRGHQVSIFVLSDVNSHKKEEYIDIYESKIVKNYFVRLPYTGFLSVPLCQILSSHNLAKVVWKVHKKNPIDILQTSNYLAPGYALRNNSKVPLVCRSSGYNPLLRSASGRSIGGLGEYLLEWLELRVILDSDGSFAPSKLTVSTYQRFEGHTLQLIHSPIEDLSKIIPDDTFYSAHLKDKTYLLYFSALNRLKGIDLLIPILPNLLKKNPKLEFVFIGHDVGLPGIPQVYPYIREYCAGYENRLHYSPPLEKSQLYPVIAHAEAIVMPSRIDNYPNACLDALILGTRVIASDNSSLEEMIVNEKTGFLVKNSDSQSLGAAINRLLNQTPEEKIIMKNNILEYAEYLKSEDPVTQLLTYYERIIQEFRKGER
jgi:glycosyltransferase involved in cell wall biosynthesis